MGERAPQQGNMRAATQDLPRSAAHPCNKRCNQVLDEADFDSYVEPLCAQFYTGLRQNSIPIDFIGFLSSRASGSRREALAHDGGRTVSH